MIIGVPRRVLLVGCLLVFGSIWFASCDAVAPGVFSLDREPERLTFSFNGAGVQAGETVTVTAPLNLLRIVERRNFTAADVVAARMVSGPSCDVVGSAACIELFAGSERLDAFALAEMRAAAVLMVSGSSFPATERAALTRRAADIAQVVVAGPVSAELTLQAARPLENRTYTIDIRFDVVIDVEG